MGVPTPNQRSKITESATRYSVTTTQQRTAKLDPGTYEIWSTSDCRFKHGPSTVGFAQIPTGVDVTQAGTSGSTHRTYGVLARDSQGKRTPLATHQITNGNATLDASNKVTVTWSDPAATVQDVAAIEVWREEGGATQGKIGEVALGVETFDDDGLVADGATAPSSSESIGGALLARAPRWFQILDAADATAEGYIALVHESVTATVEIAKVS